VYIGETHHGGKWFDGEHEAIVGRPIFDRVQEMLKTNAIRKAKPSPNGALLAGKLFDDRGNRMGPSFSSKNGVRYRFYVSSALLRGRKASAGSVGRVAAPEIERTILAALKTQRVTDSEGTAVSIDALERVVVCPDKLLITFAAPACESRKEIRIAWSTAAKDAPTVLEGAGSSEDARNDGLIQAIVRAHGWVNLLRDGVHESIEQLAQASQLHPKVVRQSLRLAFLSPDATSAILEGRQPAGLSLARIPKLLPLPWTEHRHLLG